MKKNFKKNLALLFIFTILFQFKSFDVYSKERISNVSNIDKKIVIKLEDDYYIDDNGVKTYYISPYKIIELLEANGIDIKSKLSKEQINDLIKDERELLGKKISTRSIKFINKNYTRVYLDWAKLAKYGISIGAFVLPGGLIVEFFGRQIAIATIAELAYDVYTDFGGVNMYTHKIHSSSYPLDVHLVRPVGFTGWVKGYIKTYDEKNPEISYDVASHWYYIDSDYAFVPVNTSNWKKINSKWYEFNEYGELLEHTGWRQYDGKWMYHIPGDYGAYADGWQDISGESFEFDDNGYCIDGRGCN